MSKKTDELPVRSTKIERNHLELILCGKILQRLVLLLNNIVVVKKCPELTKMTKTKKTTRKNLKKLKQQQKKQIVPRESTENRRDRHIISFRMWIQQQKPAYTGCVWETAKLIHIVLITYNTLCFLSYSASDLNMPFLFVHHL